MFVFHLHNIIERKLGDRGATPLPIMYIKHQTFLQKLLQIFFQFFHQICFKFNQICHTLGATYMKDYLANFYEQKLAFQGY
jgi:hypothetical protein